MPPPVLLHDIVTPKTVNDCRAYHAMVRHWARLKLSPPPDRLGRGLVGGRCWARGWWRSRGCPSDERDQIGNSVAKVENI